VAIAAIGATPVRLTRDTPAWRRLVGGASGDGTVTGPAVIVFHGLDRSTSRQLRLEGEAPVLGIAFDGAPLQWLEVSGRAPAVLSVAPARTPGLRIDLRPGPGAAARLRAVEVDRPRVRYAFALAAGLLTIAFTAAVASLHGVAVATALGLVLAALLILASTPALVFVTWPAVPSLAGSLFPLTLLGVAGLLASRADPPARGAIGRGAWLLAALVFGAWIRAYFLPSTGSWDTEYWKAWTSRAASHGIAGVYGDPGAVPEGHFLAQLRGREEPWRIDWGGRSFVVDYPPLAIALWRWAWGATQALGRGLDGIEAQSIAVKAPAVLGDVAAVLLLLVELRGAPGRALAIAALYWALPVSWLSSAVLGFLDGAVAPLVTAALLTAGRGRAGWAGAFLAAAALVKPTALVVLPAALMALIVTRAPIARAWLAGVAVVTAALAPFAAAGTSSAAVVHVYRILFQRTLSGGFPNLWWVVGHLLNGGGAGPVRFARVELLPLPAGAVGTALFAAAAAWITLQQRRASGGRAAALAGAALVFAYGMLAIGVHENHPHPMFLMLAATGLVSRRLRLIAAAMATVYVVNMLCLSGLGRFHGARYSLVQPLAARVQDLRMAAGFDLTLVLAAAAIALFAALLVSLRTELERAERP
jgi:hypothetical protein